MFEPAAFRAPHSEMEQLVAGIFGEVFGSTRVGLDDDFFTMGGDSLLATRVVTRLEDILQAPVPVRALFDATSVARLAEAMSLLTGTGMRPALTSSARPDHVPASFAQRRMWFLNHFGNGAPTYNMPAVFRLTGPVAVDALTAAIDDVTLRHEALRTVLADEDGELVQRVLASANWRTGNAFPAEIAEENLDQAIQTLVTREFNLSVDTPLRCALYRLSDRDHVLIVVIHHIAADGWSLRPLTRDLMDAYEARRIGNAPRWQPLNVQYGDYSLWQRSYLAAGDIDGVMARQLRYWEEELRDLPDVLQLPTDRPRTQIASQAGDVVPLRIPGATWANLKALARTQRVTPAMVMQTILSLLLHRVTGADDIPLGIPTAGRLDEALDDLVGFFVNTWVLRVSITDDQTFVDVLHSIRMKALAALAHQDVPFECVVERVDPVRSVAHHPLFQVAMGFNSDLAVPALRLSGIEVEEVAVSTRTTKTDLDFAFAEEHGEHGRLPALTGKIEFATDLFDRTTVQRLARWFTTITEAVVVDSSVVVGDIDLMDAA
ncbi:condensation domain-containing protein, partial [Nocardia sp. R7R-8]|uniref:condensation domain-containing protein n=1 Tax=Nocardia sp. R7R-8 TaxID=3459304 RepID=UPI00403DE123